MSASAAPRSRDYAARLERVFGWLADHLDDTVDLARLAEIACLSPFHFHRIYHAMRGETVAATVRRLRLHRAAVELISGTVSVPRIARRAGYGSQEAFTRAFKLAYGTPPGRYRAGLVPATPGPGPEDGTRRYEVSVREFPEVPVAALAHRGDYMRIGATFEQLLAIAAGLGLSGSAGTTLGLYHDDPAATPRRELRSHACLTVAAGWRPGPLERLEVRGGRHAVLLHVGPYAELERPYRWLYGEWLARSGEEPADAPCVEAYLNDPRRVAAAELRTEIRLPLR